MAQLLLVEDHPFVHRLLCDMLDEEGHEADCVQRFAQAEHALRCYSYDLVVSDIRLPDGSGLDIARIAAELRIKTLLISGHPEEIRVLMACNTPFLRKPFRPQEFIEAIKQHLSNRTTGEWTNHAW